MTQAEILQAQVLGNFFDRLINPWGVYSDSELMRLYRATQENQDNRNIQAIQNEMNRRNKEL